MTNKVIITSYFWKQILSIFPNSLILYTSVQFSNLTTQ